MSAILQPVAQTSPFFASPERGPLVIAHRGGSLEVPENTLAALRHGVACGASWQEIDVGLSSDDACIVLHDDSVDRTTDGAGNLAAWPIAHLTALKAGNPRWAPEARARLEQMGVAKLPTFGPRYADETVPTLEQALAVPGVRLMIELKATTKPEVLVRNVRRAVHAAGMADRVVVGSFDVPLVAMVAYLAPELPRIGIIEDPLLLPYMAQLGVAAVAVDANIMPLMHALRPKGVAVWTWTVYTEAQARLLTQAGADGLISDIPAQLLAAGRTAAAL